ncbi:NAD(P)H-dependent oxidoreductase [Halobacillus litoralis]|uniref:NAD(P)H-dependent oxidoreductase n=1 Tax=Halobacillus litoralis TaxID=45668 RepID=A0A845DPW3_9BACI|nr:NADPH-dependent FMN reductase [Halobacillus litoralis]MYL18595.1 NAD(P)H-dependent oxidoreductase [Halobacillus litoralis]
MKITVISGTPRKQGRTRQAAAEVAEKLQAALIDLSEEPLPLFNGTEEQTSHPAVEMLRKTAAESEAFVWITPEYHNGMSGALKNALEFLDSSDFKGKPILLCSVCGGGKGGMNAVNQMRTVGRGLYAMIVPQQMVFDPEDFEVDGGFIRETEERLDQVLAEFQQFFLVKQ